MPVTESHAKAIARLFVADNANVQPSLVIDIVAHKDKLTGDEEADNAFIGELLAARPNALKTVEQRADETIDIEMERKGIGKDAWPMGRAALYRKNVGKDGDEKFFNQRLAAWGASPGIITSGTEPGGEKRDAATVKKAETIIAGQYAESPFNPSKRFMTPESRYAAIAKYTAKFGTKAAQRAAAHFECDIAGRPLRKRA